jgi:hypothetical protein
VFKLVLIIHVNYEFINNMKSFRLKKSLGYYDTFITALPVYARTIIGKL